MKLAVTYEDGKVFQHFGHTETFKLYRVEDGQIVATELLASDGTGHGALAELLKRHDIDVLICGGIGGGAQAALAEQGIELCAGAQGSADEAVAAYLRGELINTGANCDHHHGEEHACGSQGCGEHGCHSEGGWDGMPVVTLVGGRLYLAVEHKDQRGGKVPMEMCLMTCPLADNWSAEIPLGSPQRFAPYPATGVYEGAPYLIHTDHYFVLSFQSADGAENTLKDEHAVGEVRIGPIADAASDKLGRFRGMQGGFRPMDIDQSAGSGLWNSLCHLGGDRFCCVSQHKGRIWITVGTIVEK